jgi:sugar lactone lactonase YvrE
MDQPKVVVPGHADVAEGPFWQPDKAAVYWVDIMPGKIMKTDASTLETETYQHHETVGAVAPRASGGLVAAVQSGFIGLDHNNSVSHSVPLLDEGYRMNDAKTDPAGRFWAGSCTMDFIKGTGSLWLLDENWNATEQYGGLTLPNGIGWTPDGTKMYLVDSMQRVILIFPFDSKSSTLTPKPTLFAGPESFDGLPDGLAIDAEGHLWVAEFGASVVSEFSPEGKKLSQIAIPTKQPTSCAFVGPNLDRMWVTSAAAGLDVNEDIHAGSIFEIGGFSAPGTPVLSFKG